MANQNVRWYSKNIRSEYWVEDKNTGEKKKFTGKGRKEKAVKYAEDLRAEYRKPKLTQADKKIQSQLKMGGYFKDPSTGVDTVDSLRADGDYIPERFKKAKTPEALERQRGVLEKSLERLTDKKTDAETGDYSDIVWTEQDQRDYDYYNRRLDEVRKGLGTHSPKAPKPGGDSGPGEPKEKKMGYWDRAEKETWIKTRANEILAEGKLMYNPARKQAEEDWEKEHNKKDPAGLFTK